MEILVLVGIVIVIALVYIFTHNRPEIVREISFRDIVFRQFAHGDCGIMPLDRPDVIPGGWYPWGKVGTIELGNGYRASVVRHYGSHGSNEGRYELAVYEFDGKEWGITYSTPITDDVLGWLYERDVTNLLRAIKELQGATK